MSPAGSRQEIVQFIDSLDASRNGDRVEMDSLALLQLIVYLEEKYRIRLAQLGLEPEDLRSIDKLAAVIDKLRPQ